MSMIRLFAAAALAIPLTFACAAAPAAAASVGFYGSYGAGSADGDDPGGWEGGGAGWDADTRHVGAGVAMVLPTAWFRFNYRLGLGWERIESEGENGRPERELDGLVFDQDLTYDLFAGQSVRFWIGPELRLGFFDGSFFDEGRDRDYFAAGVGPVAGLDFALGPNVALSWKLGYLFTWYSTGDDPRGGGHPPGSYGPPGEEETVDGGHAYTSLTLLFRLWGGPPPGPPPGPLPGPPPPVPPPHQP